MTATSKKKIGFATVREVGLVLPDVEEGTTYGSPVLKVRGKMFACLAIHRSAERDSLAVRIDFDQRDALIAADPDTYRCFAVADTYPRAAEREALHRSSFLL